MEARIIPLLEQMEARLASLDAKLAEFVPEANSETNQRLMSRNEVSELCGVSLVTLHNWKKKGLLVPAKKAGRKPLYLLSDVLHFLDGNNAN